MLDELHYEEHEVSRVGPNWCDDIVSCNTYNQVDDLIVVHAIREWGLWPKCYTSHVEMSSELISMDRAPTERDIGFT